MGSNTILNLPAQIGLLTAQVAALAAQIAALAPLYGQLAALAHQVAALRANVVIASARSFNASALLGTHLLRPLPNVVNVMPGAAVPAVWFPPNLNSTTVQAVFTTQQVTALLAFYGLPIGGTFAAKRSRFLVHIGIRA